MSLIRAAFIATLLLPAGAMAADPAPPTLDILPEAVGVLALRDTGFAETILFIDQDNSRPVAIRALETQLETALMNALTAYPNTQALPLESLKARMEARGDLRTATQTIRKGMEAGEAAYKRMNLDAALEHLNSARAQSQEHHLDLVHPELVGKIAFLQGLALLEQGKTAQAHVAFKEAIRFEPHQGRVRGYYPNTVEEAMQAALAELRTSLAPELSFESGRLAALMKRAQVTQLAIPSLLGTGTARTLRLVVFDRRKKDIVFRANIALQSPASDVDQIDRAVSRWRTCVVVETEGEVPLPRKTSVFVDTNFTHGIFLQHPTRQPMQNLGLTVHLGWLALDNLEVSGQVTTHFSLADSFGDQEGEMTSVRGAIGAAFVQHWGPWRWYFRPGVEIHRIGRLRVITDAHCKFFGIDHPACPAGSVTDLDEAILAGLQVATGASVNLGDHLKINLGVGFSGYLANESSELNRLVTSEFGIGYRF